MDEEQDTVLSMLPTTGGKHMVSTSEILSAVTLAHGIVPHKKLVFLPENHHK